MPNDWTLDTNVLINANGPRPLGRARQEVRAAAPQAGAPIGTCQTARALLKCIGRCGYWNWSVAVAQEYINRGAINLRSCPPPIPVVNQSNHTFCDAWLADLGHQQRIIYHRSVRRLTGAEEDDLRRAQFRDRGDHPFLELARSSESKCLVTQEADYNANTIRSIRRILAVTCYDYAMALRDCQVAGGE